MTINVTVVTRDAIVFGTDSVASVTKVVVDPTAYFERDADGKFVEDAQGRYSAKIPPSAHEWVVIDARGGATKMFELTDRGSKVAATTAGMATLGGRSIHNLAMQFRRETGGYATVKETAEKFLEFVRARYDEHYAADETPEAFRNDVEFLVGGYGENDHFPSLYRLRVQSKACETLYENGTHGIAWAGQSDGVARLIFGYDHMLKYRAQRQATEFIDATYQQFSESVARILGDVLDRLGATLPEGVNTSLPEKPQVQFPWADFQLDIEVASLPLQDAVDLVSYLVNLQSGRAKFVRGVATVGGRTRIGVITRHEKFRTLNEPEIVHRSTGFTVDF